MPFDSAAGVAVRLTSGVVVMPPERTKPQLALGFRTGAPPGIRTQNQWIKDSRG